MAREYTEEERAAAVSTSQSRSMKPRRRTDVRCPLCLEPDPYRR